MGSDPKPEVVQAAPAAYRPPRARNKPAVAAAPEVVSVAKKFVPKSQQAKTATPLGELSKAAQKNKRRRQKKKQKQDTTSDQAEPTNDANAAPNANTEDQNAEKKRRVKALNKKIRQIEA